MSYTIHPVLIDKPNSKELCPVKILISVKGKRHVVSCGIRVLKSQWEDGRVVNHPSANKLNAKIRNKHKELEDKLLDQLEDGSVSFQEFNKVKEYRIVKYMETFIAESESKYAFNTIKKYKIEYERLKKFRPEITFSSADTAFLRQYENHLRLTMQTNAVNRSFAVLKSIFKKAASEGLTKKFPFKDYDQPRYQQTLRTYLTSKEVSNFEKALKKPYDKGIYESGMYFLLGCFSGLRVSDLLRFNKEFIQGERLILRAEKNGVLISIKMNRKLKSIAKAVLKLKRPVNEDYINRDIKVIAKQAGINKHLHAHCARHSMAIRCAESGISIEVTAKLLGITIKSCESYYKITSPKIDKEFEMFR